MPHFHYDPVWVEDQRTYTRQAFELILQYLRACREDEGYHLLLSELDYLKPFFAVHGEERDFVRELVESERLQLGGSYNEPNEMTLQGEAIIRNLVHGRLYHEGSLRASPDVYLPLDVFGHCLQLPQIAAKAGFGAIVWSKGAPGGPPLHRALAPDGTEILQKREPYWYRPGSLRELLESVGKGLAGEEAVGVTQDLRLLGHDMAPPLDWLESTRLAAETLDPVVMISTPHRYLAALKRELDSGEAEIPILGRDLSWYHMGTLVSRSDLKLANRLAENRLLSAERWATLAAVVGAKYPDLALDKAWRQVLFGQHHDAMTGTSDDIGFLDLLCGYREALELAEEVERRALSYIAAHVQTEGARRAPSEGGALVVFNAMGWERTDVCRARVHLRGRLAGGFRLTDDRGHAVPVQLVSRSPEGPAGATGQPDEERWVEIAFLATGIPSVGYRSYYLAPAPELPPAAEPADAGATGIENEHLSLRADPEAGGGLVSIYDKRAKRELVNTQAGPANEVVALGEKPDREMPSWELFTTGEEVRGSGQPAELSVLQGPVFSQIRVRSELPDRCGLLQEITLYRGMRRVDLRTSLGGYRGQHELLALSFPLAIKGGPTFEDRFAAVVRRPSRGRFDFRTREDENLSKCGVGAAQNWVEVGPVPSLDIVDREKRTGAVGLGPCAIITSGAPEDRAAVRTLTAALLSRGITCTPYVDTEDPAADPECGFHISLGRGNGYSRRLLGAAPQAAARLEEAQEGRDWTGVLLRQAGSAGGEAEVPVLVADTAAPEGVPALAARLAEAVRAGALEIPASCDFSGLASACDDYGIAVINRGTLAASLESDGTLALPLFHTAAWGFHPWGEGRLERFLVPEHKSHVYEHALLAHPGDWRSGGVVRAGCEVNNPLRAVQTEVRGGVVPPTFSLVSVDAPNLVITAIKPLGNPMADHSATERSSPDTGILVRCYEAHGEAAEAHFMFGAEPTEAWLTDLMEGRAGQAEVTPPGWRRPASVPIRVSPCAIISVAVHLAPLPTRGETQELGPSAEPASPVHSRYWEHNAGAAPMGNQPVTIWLRGSVPPGQNTRFTLGLSNDYRDREITGRARLTVPPDWQLIPREVPYRIGPGAQTIYEVMVVVPAGAPGCFLRAAVEDGERVVQDVLPVGEIQPLGISLRRGEAGFLVKVRNPNADYVEGLLALITPVEFWGETVEGMRLGGVSPRAQAFRLAAGEERTFVFALQGNGEGLWAVAKAMWYGRVQYVQESD